VPFAATPMSGAPMSGAPMSGVPISGVPMSGAPMSGVPMSPAPAPSGFTAPATTLPGGLVATTGVPVAWPSPTRPALPPRRRQSLARLAVGPLATVLLMPILIIGAVAWQWDNIAGIASRATNPNTGSSSAAADTGKQQTFGSAKTLTAVAKIDVPATQASAMTLNQDTLYHAVAGVSSTQVVATAVNGGAQTWKQTVEVASGTLRLRVVGDLLIFDAERATNKNSEDYRAVLDAKTGTVKWVGSWKNLTDVAYLGTDVLVQHEQGVRTSLAKYDLLTGKAKWDRTAVSNMYSIDVGISRPVFVSPTTASATGTAAALTRSEQSFNVPYAVDPSTTVEFTESEKRLNVVSTADGKNKGITISADFDADTWTVFNGLAIGPMSDASNTVSAFSLTTGKVSWMYSTVAGTTFDQIRPCAEQLVCVSGSNSGGGDFLSALNLSDGTQKWQRTFTSIGTMEWNPVGNLLMVGDGIIDSLDEVIMLDPASAKGDTKFTVSTNTGPRARATSGSKLAVTGTTTGSKWQIAVFDAGQIKYIAQGDAGSGYPTKATVSGGAAAVLTTDGKLLLYALPSSTK
jgi:molecular chaperone HscA